MIVTCENCNTRFNLDETLLKPTGSKVRCSLCKTVFTAWPESPPETGEAESPAEVALSGEDHAEKAALAGDAPGYPDTGAVEGEKAPPESIDMDISFDMGGDETEVAPSVAFKELDLETDFDTEETETLPSFEDIDLEMEFDTGEGEAAPGDLEKEPSEMFGDLDLGMEFDTGEGEAAPGDLEKEPSEVFGDLDLEMEFDTGEEPAAPGDLEKEPSEIFGDLDLEMEFDTGEEPAPDSPPVEELDFSDIEGMLESDEGDDQGFDFSEIDDLLEGDGDTDDIGLELELIGDLETELSDLDKGPGDTGTELIDEPLMGLETALAGDGTADASMEAPEIDLELPESLGIEFEDLGLDLPDADRETFGEPEITMEGPEKTGDAVAVSEPPELDFEELGLEMDLTGTGAVPEPDSSTELPDLTESGVETPLVEMESPDESAEKQDIETKLSDSQMAEIGDLDFRYDDEAMKVPPHWEDLPESEALQEPAATDEQGEPETPLEEPAEAEAPFEEPAEQEFVMEETPVPLVEEEIPSPEEAPPRKKVRLPLVLLLVAVLAGAGGYGLYMMRDSVEINIPSLTIIGEKLPFLSDFFPPPVATPPPRAVTPLKETVNGHFVTNTKAGKLFVINGKVKVTSDKPRRFIRVTGSLVSKGDTVAKTRTVYCGNILPNLDLTNLDMASIDKHLANKEGDNKINLNVPPGKIIPFMIVFSDLPENLENFTIEVASSMEVR